MPALETLGAWLLTYFVHSTLLIGAVLVACYWIEKRPRVQDTLLKLALVGGMVTATVQMSFGVAPLAGNMSVATAPALAVPAAQPVVTAAKPIATTPATGATSPRIEIVARPRGAAADAAPLVGTVASTPVATSTPAAGGSWLSLLVLAWLVGAAVFSSLLLVSWVRLRRRLRGRRELTDGPLRFMLDNLLREAGVRGTVRLTASADIEVPIAIGVVRREICVPERALSELSYEHQQSLLAHETAHLVRRDPQWRLFGSIVQGALFIQPLNRLINRRMHAASEHLCDDWAITRTERPLALAKCLTVVARWVTNPHHTKAVPAMASHRSGLGRRVRRLVEPEKGAATALPRWSLAGLGALLALIVIAAPGASNASDSVAPKVVVELADSAAPIEGEADLPGTPAHPDAMRVGGPSAPIAAHPAGAYPDDMADAVRVYAYSWGGDDDEIREALEAYGIDLDDVLSPEELAELEKLAEELGDVIGAEDLEELEKLAEELEGAFGPGGDFDFDDFNDFDFDDFNDFDFDDFNDFDFDDFQVHPFGGDDIVIFDGDLADLEDMFDGDIDIRGLQELLEGNIDADIDIDIDIRIDGKPLDDYIDIFIEDMPQDIDSIIELYEELHGANGEKVKELAEKHAKRAQKLAKKHAKRAKKLAEKHAKHAKKHAKKHAERAKKHAKRVKKHAKEHAERAKERAKRAKERAKKAKQRAKKKKAKKKKAKKKSKHDHGATHDGGHSHAKPIDAIIADEIRAFGAVTPENAEELERLIEEIVSESLEDSDMY
jgi:beta-lactamase regulating signal transducer with metallopeptidase domain/cell division septum initiation protein DivIVA